MDASRNAHALGVGPAVFDWLAADGIEIAEFIADRRPCTHADFCDPAICHSAVAASGFDMVPCFNDPMSGNFLVDDAKAIMLIDYEYASNNDRCYDLGIWFGEMFFDPAREAELTKAYFGRVTPQAAARIKVCKALADIKWATWSMVQEKVSSLDFDYRKYGVWKHMRARRVMHDPRWPGWLRTL